MHTIYGPGNPISLGASIEPAAIELCHNKINRLWNQISIFNNKTFFFFFSKQYSATKILEPVDKMSPICNEIKGQCWHGSHVNREGGGI